MFPEEEILRRMSDEEIYIQKGRSGYLRAVLYGYIV